MTSWLRWVRIRRLEWYLVVAVACGVGGAVIGHTLVPVPGELFADVSGVPLVYLVPLALGVAVARWRPAGAFWIETEPDPLPTSVVLAMGCAFASLPLILASPGSDPALVATRNTVAAVALSALLRAYGVSVPATTASTIAPYLAVWTFGWNLEDRPHPWALPILPPGSPVALGVTTILAAGAIVGLRRLAVAR